MQGNQQQNHRAWRFAAGGGALDFVACCGLGLVLGAGLGLTAFTIHGSF